MAASLQPYQISQELYYILLSHDSPLAWKRYLMGATLKELEILKCKETMANKEKSQKDCRLSFNNSERPAHHECNDSFRKLACP